MKETYSIRKYQPGDEKGIVELLQLVFNGWPQFDINCSPIDYWRWKYEDNPLEKRVVPIADYDGLIVGLNHGATLQIKLGNKILSSSQGTDLAVHPDFRRMGIYTKMSEFKTDLYRENKTNITWALTGNPIVYKTNIKWGNSPYPHPISIFYRIRDIGLHFEKKTYKHHILKKCGVYLLKIINTLLYSKGKLYGNNNNKISNILSVNHFDNKINNFWDDVKEHYSFIIVRKQDYLNWRYCDPRGGEYTIKISEEENKITGYIVLRINRYHPDYPEGYIVDMLTFPDRHDVAESLLRDSIRFFDKNNINVIHCLVIKKHPYEVLLKQHGFVDIRNRVYFIIKLIDGGSEWDDFLSAPPNKMHFQYGDTDWI